MESAFTWTDGQGSETTRSHLTDRVTIVPRPDADAYEVLRSDGAVEMALDVRGLWLEIEVDTSAPAGLAGAAGGSGRSLRRVWLDLLNGDDLTYYPDASDLTVAVPVVPMLSHTPTLYAVRAGTLAPGAVLSLRSRSRYAPDDQLLRDLAAASPYS